MEHEGLGFGRDGPAAKGRRSILPRATPLRVLILVISICTYVTISDFFVQLDPCQPSDEPSIRWSRVPLNATRAMYITMHRDSQSTENFQAVAKRIAGFTSVEIVDGVDGANVPDSDVSLYTRFLIQNGRNAHQEISTLGMVGCYMSHVKVLRRLEPGDVAAVFEEDAIFTRPRLHHLKALDEYVQSTLGRNFDLLYIGTNVIFAQGGPHASVEKKVEIAPGMTLTECVKDCAVYGTRGYFVTYEGAQKILRHSKPVQVQVDALYSLVSSYEPGFRTFWVDQDIVAGPRYIDFVKLTQVQDACLKCILPTGTGFYYFLIALLVVTGLSTLFFLVWHLLPLCGISNDWVRDMCDEALEMMGRRPRIRPASKPVWGMDFKNGREP